VRRPVGLVAVVLATSENWQECPIAGGHAPKQQY